MADLTKKYDVLVVGGGNAALCAAISARRAGASVLVLEVASKFYRGGNTRHTRNMRCAHDAATKELTGPYTEDEFFDDLLRVTGGNTDEPLARHMIHESKAMLDWIAEQGVRFQPSLGGTLSLGRTNSFFLGGGRAMLNALYRTAEELGVEVDYLMLRGIFLPGGVTPDQTAYYVDVLKKVVGTPEWKEYMENNALKSVFLSGKDFEDFLTKDEARHKEIMTAAGFTVYFLNGYRATPELSFTVREKKCSCGIMVTASHNPPKPKQKLIELVRANKPLIEIGIGLYEEVDSEEVLRNLNELADDFAASYSIYRAMTGDTRFLRAETTPEALLLLPKRCINRVGIARIDPHIVGALVVVFVEHLLERRSAISRAENPAFRIR